MSVKKIKEYRVFDNTYNNRTVNKETFSIQITRKILDEGWQPYGLPTMFDLGTNGILISQVMVRYEEDDGLVKKEEI